MNMLTEIILNDKVTNENIRVQVIRSGRKVSAWRCDRMERYLQGFRRDYLTGN